MSQAATSAVGWMRTMASSSRGSSCPLCPITWPVGSSRHLNRKPTNAGTVPSPIALAVGDSERVGVLNLVGPAPVPVLEVEPGVFYGLTVELVDHLRRHLAGQIVWLAEVGTQPLNSTVLVDQGGGRTSPLVRQVHGVLVGWHVDGVHRLPSGVITWVSTCGECVGGGQPLVDLGKDLLGKPDWHRDGWTDSGHFTNSYAGSVRKSAKSSLRHKSLINFLAG
jgi:hypothetical protein